MMPRKAAIAPITAGKGNCVWAVSSGGAAVVPIHRKELKLSYYVAFVLLL